MAASTTTNNNKSRQRTRIPQHEWDKGLAAVDVSKSDLNKLVLDWLIIEGYRDAAVSFASELELDAQASQPSTAISDPISNPGKIDFDSIHERMLIRESIEAGRIDEAVRRVNELDSEILDTNPPLLFHLHLQRFIELIRHGKVPEALEFASTELAPRGAQNPEFLGDLEKTMALLAFPELAALSSDEDEQDLPADGPDPLAKQPAWASLGGLLRRDHRTKVARELNAAILESQGQGQETKLSGMVRLMCWGETQLRDKGVEVPGLDVAGLLGDVSTAKVGAADRPSERESDEMQVG